MVGFVLVLRSVAANGLPLKGMLPFLVRLPIKEKTSLSVSLLLFLSLPPPLSLSSPLSNS